MPRSGVRFVVSLISLAIGANVTADDRSDPLHVGLRAERPPRKVLIGTAIFGPYGKYPGLETRLQELAGLVDEMAEQAKKNHAGKRLDLALLPETVVSPSGETAEKRGLPLKGRVQDFFSALARKHQTYLLAPFDMKEDDAASAVVVNAAVLFDRSGTVVGTYRKAHPVAYVNSDILEGGVTPGQDFPVFDCDFGRLGIQICWDIQFPDGWDRLARSGAEIVAWPTASPATVLPASRAALHRYYVVSSTWRDNATIFEPTGMVAAQVLPPERVLVHEIDLSYAILGWSGFLRDGEALREKFGDKVGFHYSRREDTGLFWSNDPSTSIGTMIRAIGGEGLDHQINRNLRLQINRQKQARTEDVNIRLRKLEDRAQVDSNNHGAVVTLTSKSGIGAATLEAPRGGWPSGLTVRLKLLGLESLRISNGKTTLQASLTSNQGRKDSTMLAIDLKAMDSRGKPCHPPLADGGWFEFQVPASLLAGEPSNIAIEWIDFYR